VKVDTIWHMTRWVHFRIAEELYERARAAATADRRSLSNWLALVVERALGSGEDDGSS
jgi:predicted HicB family RNase H-like nuclease